MPSSTLGWSGDGKWKKVTGVCAGVDRVRYSDWPLALGRCATGPDFVARLTDGLVLGLDVEEEAVDVRRRGPCDVPGAFDS